MQNKAQHVEQIEKGSYWSRKVSWRILAVDDDPDVNIALQKMLEQNGFNVDSYDDPLLALENFKPHSYDLVILDIKMPEMNGFSLYRAIKNLDKNLKICFLTAGEMYYGANCFIRKPIDNQELMKRINEILIDGSTSKQVT